MLSVLPCPQVAGFAIHVAATFALRPVSPAAPGSGGARASIPMRRFRWRLLVPAGSGQATRPVVGAVLQNAARLAIADLGGVGSTCGSTTPPASPGRPGHGPCGGRRRARDHPRARFCAGGQCRWRGHGAAGHQCAVLFQQCRHRGRQCVCPWANLPEHANRLVRLCRRQGSARIMIVHDRKHRRPAGRRPSRKASRGQAGRSWPRRATNSARTASPVRQAARQIAATREVIRGGCAVHDRRQCRCLAAADPDFARQRVERRGDAFHRPDPLGHVPQATLALPGVQGGWFALPDPALYRQFQTRYQAAYGEARIRSRGLPMTASRPSGRWSKPAGDALTVARADPGSGFVGGVNGIFRLRPMAPTNAALPWPGPQQSGVVIDPAPRSFAGAGF
jgi:hypothetical protein